MSGQIIHRNHPWSIVAVCMWIFPVCDIPLQVCVHAIRPALAIIGEHFPHSLALTSPLVLRSGRKIKLLFFPFPYRSHAWVSMAASHLHSGTGQHFSHDPLVHSCLLLVSVLSSAVRQTTFLPCLKSSMTLCLSSLSLVGLVYCIVHMSIVWRWLGNGFITSEADPSLCVPHQRYSPLGA